MEHGQSCAGKPRSKSRSHIPLLLLILLIPLLPLILLLLLLLLIPLLLLLPLLLLIPLLPLLPRSQPLLMLNLAFPISVTAG